MNKAKRKAKNKIGRKPLDAANGKMKTRITVNLTYPVYGWLEKTAKAMGLGINARARQVLTEAHGKTQK